MGRPEAASRIVAVGNEGVAAWCAKEPARLLPIGAVTLRYSDLAVGQRVTAVRDLGTREVQITTSAGPGRELDDPSPADFWAAAEELGTAVFIHPWAAPSASG
ncbi:amidohydrolase family protein [Streptomyces europaeiscabiei]